MLRLLKILVGVGCFAAFVWVGLTVKLGERTFFGHVYAIGRSKESKELVRGTKERVGNVTRLLHSEAAPRDPHAAPAPTAPPQEEISSADRHELRRVIESARGPVTR